MKNLSKLQREYFNPMMAALEISRPELEASERAERARYAITSNFAAEAAIMFERRLRKAVALGSVCAASLAATATSAAVAHVSPLTLIAAAATIVTGMAAKRQLTLANRLGTLVSEQFTSMGLGLHRGAPIYLPWKQREHKDFCNVYDKAEKRLKDDIETLSYVPTPEQRRADIRRYTGGLRVAVPTT
jgi:hypothetical protein